MDKKKGLDLAAGRLARGIGPGRPGHAKKATSYGTNRLGITGTDEQAEPIPTAPEPPASVPLSEEEERLAPPASQVFDLSAEDETPPRRHEPAEGMRTALLDLSQMASGTPSLPTRPQAPDGGAWAHWSAACRQRPILWALPIGGLVVVGALIVMLFSGGEDVPSAGPRRARAATAAPTSRPSPKFPRTTKVIAVHRDPRRRLNMDDPYARPPRQPEPKWAEALPSILPDRPKPTNRPPKPPLRVAPPFQPRESPPRPKPPAARPPAATPQPSAPPTPRPDDPAKPKAVQYITCPRGFWFTGVIHQKTGTYANVNDRFVKVGSEVNGATVLSIEQTSVEMERNGKRFFISYGSKPPPPAEEDEGDESLNEDEAEDEQDDDAESRDDRPSRKKRRGTRKKSKSDDDDSD